MSEFPSLFPLAFGLLNSPVAMIVLLILALIIFGKRLPDVARSLGKGIVEFKKGVKGIEDDVDRSSYNQRPMNSPPYQDQAAPPPPPPAYSQPQPPAQAPAAPPPAQPAPRD